MFIYQYVLLKLILLQLENKRVWKIIKLSNMQQFFGLYVAKIKGGHGSQHVGSVISLGNFKTLVSVIR